MRLPFFRDKSPAPATPPSDDATVQAARTAARRRLVGALVLLLMGVVGFPLLFETQPRPLPAHTPIYLPEGTPARVAPPTAAPSPRPPVAVVPPPDAGTEAVSMAASATAATPAPSAAAAAAPKPPSPPVVSISPAPKPASAAAATAAAASGRFIVQVGAYNDSERMKAARQKVDKLGFKSYTQEVDTPDGKRTRVRAGPFATRPEAEAAAAKLKAAGLQANVLAL